MEDYQKRMIEEYKELRNKIDKLTVFLSRTTTLGNIGEEKYSLMQAQLYSMMAYAKILKMRMHLEKEISAEEYES